MDESRDGMARSVNERLGSGRACGVHGKRRLKLRYKNARGVDGDEEYRR